MSAVFSSLANFTTIRFWVSYFFSLETKLQNSKLIYEMDYLELGIWMDLH